MNENDIQTLAVVDEDRRLKGLLTLGDIARFYIEDCLLYTSCLNIIALLQPAVPLCGRLRPSITIIAG